MDGCIYRTKDGECDLYAEGGKYKAWCEMDGCDGRKMSNGDRIRAMTDEEIAEQIVKCRDSDIFRKTVLGTNMNTEREWLDWLKQEVDNG